MFSLFYREQNFLNYLSLHDYRRAIELALAMEQPGRLFSLFKQIIPSSCESALSGDPTVDEVIRSMGGPELAKLFRFLRDWNANAKTSTVAQTILYAIIKLQPAENILKAFELGDPGDSVKSGNTSLKEMMDALIPYTERHLSRLEVLVQDSYMVDYILAEMDNGMLDNESMITD